jgi:hypothetical protein
MYIGIVLQERMVGSVYEAGLRAHGQGDIRTALDNYSTVISKVYDRKTHVVDHELLLSLCPPQVCHHLSRIAVSLITRVVLVWR